MLQDSSTESRVSWTVKSMYLRCKVSDPLGLFVLNLRDHSCPFLRHPENYPSIGQLVRATSCNAMRRLGLSCSLSCRLHSLISVTCSILARYHVRISLFFLGVSCAPCSETCMHLLERNSVGCYPKQLCGFQLYAPEHLSGACT